MAASPLGASVANGTGPPYKAKAIANYFLELGQRDDVALTPMKLQKLIYFAHGWYLAFHGKPLIDERIQAWEFGPVIRTVYDEFKGQGKARIDEPALSYELSGSRLVAFKPEVPESDTQTRMLLDRIWEVYKGLTAYQLSTLTHQANSPWEKTYNAHPGVRNLTIDDVDITAYFRKMLDDNRQRRAAEETPV